VGGPPAPLLAGTETEVQLSGRCAVPSNAKTVSIMAYLTETADGTPVTPAFTPDPAASAGTASPGTATPTPSGPTVGPVTVDVNADGSFDAPLDLSTGKWRIVVTATSAEGKAVSLVRNVAIVYRGVNLVVQIKGSSAWLKVWVDGKIWKTTGAAGQVYNPGKVLTINAKNTIEVRTGKSSATYFTLNGENLGRLSKQSNPATYLFNPPDPPVETNRN
jgi:hypothetical protein